jgi:heme A synthase
MNGSQLKINILRDIIALQKRNVKVIGGPLSQSDWPDCYETITKKT